MRVCGCVCFARIFVLSVEENDGGGGGLQICIIVCTVVSVGDKGVKAV